MKTEKYLQIGDSLEKEFMVEAEHTAAHIGSGAVTVLATPLMIAFMEITARTLLDQNLPEGYSSVGTRVDIKHLAPTASGKKVRVKVEIVYVEGNRVKLDISVWEGEIKVGEGSHERYMIEIARFLERIK